MKYRRTLIKVLIAVVVLIVAMTALYHYQRAQEIYQQNLSETTARAREHIAFTQSEYEHSFTAFRSTLELVAGGQVFQQFLRIPSATEQQRLVKHWQVLLKSQPMFLSLSFVDIRGNQPVTTVANERKLGDKPKVSAALMKESIVKYAESIEDGKIALWDNRFSIVDTSQNHQKLKAKLIRPVSVNGQRVGYLVLSLNTVKISDRVNTSSDPSIRAYVIDPQGYFVMNRLPEALSHQVDSSNQLLKFAQFFPKSWQKMHQFEDGFVVENGTLNVFQTMHLSNQHRAHVVISLSESQLMSFAADEIYALNRETGFALFISLLVFVPTIFALMYYRRNSIDSHLARAALSGMSAVMILDRYCKTVLVNPEFSRLTGLSGPLVESKNVLKSLLGPSHIGLLKSMFSEVKQNHIWEDEVILYSGEREITTIMRVQSSFNSKGKLSYYIVSFVDISERKMLEEKLRILSEKDTMSDLWNRRKFELELRRCAMTSQLHHSSKPTCLALIDIDHFKRINDQLGHDEGDRIISHISRVMASEVRYSDFLARIGGEEFAVIMPNTSITDANLALNRLREQVQNDDSTHVTVSIGFTQLTTDYTRSYKCADIALYESKTIGRNQVSVCLDCEEIA